MQGVHQLKYLLIILSLFLTSPVLAHQLSTAYLTGELEQQGLLSGELQIRGFDFNLALALDSDNNGQLTWLEVNSRSQKINQYIAQNLSFSRAGEACQLMISPQLKADKHFNQGYIVTDFKAQCALEGPISIHYQALFQHDSEHKLIVNLSAADDAIVSRVMTANQQSVQLDMANGSLMNTVVEYVYQGMLHIWKGLDHILFLLVLLLTCVLYRENRQWQVKQNYRQIITSTAWIVTAFTLAHSITLTATAMNWMTVNSRWVEIGIAISVLLAALNNIWPLVVRVAGLTFAFGLLHGMGFAGVLSELGLPSDQKFWSVLSFNLGVEIGQLCILALVLPVLIWLRNFNWYAQYFVRCSSLLIAVIALQWTLERF